MKTPAEKNVLHPRNRHRGRYDFAALTACHPASTPLVAVNNWGSETVDFADPEAVKALNALTSGKTVSKTILVPATVVTKANVDSYRAIFK